MQFPGSPLPHLDIDQWKHTMFTNLILLCRALSHHNLTMVCIINADIYSLFIVMHICHSIRYSTVDKCLSIYYAYKVQLIKYWHITDVVFQWNMFIVFCMSQLLFIDKCLKSPWCNIPTKHVHSILYVQGAFHW